MKLKKHFQMEYDYMSQISMKKKNQPVFGSSTVHTTKKASRKYLIMRYLSLNLNNEVPSKTLNYFDLGTSLKGTCWGPEIVVKLSILT